MQNYVCSYDKNNLKCVLNTLLLHKVLEKLPGDKERSNHMETEQQTRTNASLSWFNPLEGSEGRVHGRCIQGRLGDPNIESSVDTCCWGEHKHPCQLHNSSLENLKEKIEYMFKWLHSFFFFFGSMSHSATDIYLNLQCRAFLSSFWQSGYLQKHCQHAYDAIGF